MGVLNFVILFLQESRSFLSNVFEVQSSLLMFSVLGLQFLLFFIVASFEKFSIPKITFLLFLFVPIYLFNKFALHIVFIILNIINYRELSLKQVIKYALTIRAFFLALLLLMIIMGKTHDTTWVMLKGSAHTLGFSNPNATSKFLNGFILLLSLYLLVSKKNLFLNFLLILPAYLIYKTTFGRTYFIGLIVYFLFLFLFRCRLFYKHNYWLYRIVPILLGSLIIVGIRLFAEYPWLDLVFSKRLSFSKQIIDEFSYLNYIIGSSYIPEGLTIDSSYLLLFCEAGIFSVLIFIILYFNFIKKISFAEAKLFFPFIFTMLIAGLTEITFPVFSAVSVIFYKILYQTSATYGNKRSLR